MDFVVLKHIKYLSNLVIQLLLQNILAALAVNYREHLPGFFGLRALREDHSDGSGRDDGAQDRFDRILEQVHVQLGAGRHGRAGLLVEY